MSSIHALIKYEEGWREKPYLCTEGYPTVGFGFRIGPQGADIKLYQFILPLAAGEEWLRGHLIKMDREMRTFPHLGKALDAAEPFPARTAVLYSMAYQLGVKGLGNFKNTLAAVARGDWNGAATGMLDSRWAKQTPKRAQRHAEQMRTGRWASVYGA